MYGQVYEGETVEGKVVDNTFPTLEQVNKNALKKLNDLIEDASSEERPGLIESLAKYNASIRNNDVFTKETEEERRAKEKSNIVEGLLKR